MPEYIETKDSNCKNCHKCIRHCPVKAISFSQNKAHILKEDCIICGKCCINCPQGVKSPRNDLLIAKTLLQGKEDVYVSLAPSFAAAFDNISFDSLKKSLIQLGFKGVEETALGAVAVKKRYEELIVDGRQRIIISSCCHSINTLIYKYYPRVTPMLAKVITPMMAHGKMLKHSYPNCKVVFIGPCISKKAEADGCQDLIDCVLTFKELSLWFEKEGITPEYTESLPEIIGKTRLFPTVGGIIDSMDIDKNSAYSFIAVDGVENCILALEDLDSGVSKPCFIEMSACAGSCAGGPAMGKLKYAPLKNRLAVRSLAGSEDFAVKQFNAETLERKTPITFIHREKPDSILIEEILQKMGKTLPHHELNCGSCGYDTCREKAAAVLEGKAEITMCLPYLMDRAESFSDTIISNTPNGVIVLNLSLEIQRINTAGRRILSVQDEEAVLGRDIACILDPIPFAHVISERENLYENPMFLAEYNKYVRITILFDETYDIIIAIMRDVTEESNERAGKTNLEQKAIEIADKVIEKQMRTVQEIASLLGETTAETKVALERLKESLAK